ncbi:MAG: hypothetical protein HY317_06245 [Acidobacteria bacterium]|nr:hypothetical protein [Acidobacteriota bacterium]
MSRSSRGHALVVLGAALALRLGLILVFDREAGDVLRYRRVAVAVLEGQWNPYALKHLYPYPPVWIWFEAGAEWLARATGLGFPVLVKLPVLAADLGIVAVLLRWPRPAGRAAWLYALHPVSLLVTGVHGQFDALMLLPALLAVRWHDEGRYDRSALGLAAAIAVKSIPVLLLPFLAPRGADGRARWRFLVLGTAPVALLLLPYAIADPTALLRELFGYGGVADFGWIGLVRGAAWWTTGRLARSDAAHWGALVPVAKALFLVVYAALAAAFWRGRLRWPSSVAALAVFLAFQVLYGSVSAQYLLWVVPFAVLAPDRSFAAHTVAATAALVGFYAFLQPEMLPGDTALMAGSREAAGRLWVLGVAGVLSAGAFWLLSLVRRGRRSAEG